MQSRKVFATALKHRWKINRDATSTTHRYRRDGVLLIVYYDWSGNVCAVERHGPGEPFPEGKSPLRRYRALLAVLRS